MRFRIVVFAEFFAGTGGVEVAQRGVLHSLRFIKPVEQSLDDEFRFPVWAARNQRFIFGDGDAVGFIK